MPAPTNGRAHKHCDRNALLPCQNQKPPSNDYCYYYHYYCYCYYYYYCYCYYYLLPLLLPIKAGPGACKLGSAGRVGIN